MTSPTYASRNIAADPAFDRALIVRRAEELRAEQVQRLFQALARRIRQVFTGNGQATETVFIPRSPSSAIF